MKRFVSAFVLLAAMWALPSHGVLIHQWNFDDNTANDSVGTRDLNEVGAPAQHVRVVSLGR